MFETLQDQMKIDDRRATTTQARVVFWLTIAVLSIILFSASISAFFCYKEARSGFVSKCCFAS
jgi:hypothetical protein